MKLSSLANPQKYEELKKALISQGISKDQDYLNDYHLDNIEKTRDREAWLTLMGNSLDIVVGNN